MDRADAKTRLGRMVAFDASPVLSDADLDALLDTYPLLDVTGYRSTDTAWEPVWDLNAAAAEGWRWKAAKVAGDFTFSADDASYSKGDVLAQCLEMEAKYASRVNGTSRVEGAQDTRLYHSENYPTDVLLP